jgi:hypothetical protein
MVEKVSFPEKFMTLARNSLIPSFHIVTATLKAIKNSPQPSL